MKKQTRVLRELIRGKDEMTVNELVKNTEFTKRQVYNALADLKRRRLIIKTKESSGAKLRIPPKNVIYIKIPKAVFKRAKDVIKKELVKKEQENDK